MQRRLLLWTIACSLTASPAFATSRKLSLAEAVELGMRVDPLVAEAKVAEDRSKLAVLRAQLDRVSLKIDGQVQELWSKNNIGGPSQSFPTCTNNGVVQPLDPASCAFAGGMVGPTVTPPDQSPSQTLGLFNFSANANVPIFSGFRVSSNVKRAQRLEEASSVGIRQARKDTALSVARAYWAVRRVTLLRDVQAAALERLREEEAIIDGRVKAGLAPPIDKSRATLRRLQQTATFEDYAGQVRETTAQLAVALGIGGEVELTEPAIVPETAPPPVDQLLADAHTGRPELKTARLQIEAQHQYVRMAQSNFYPQLTGTGLFQYGNNPYSIGVGARQTSSSAANPFTNLSGSLTLGATLSMNFFDTLNTYTQSQDAKHEETRLLQEQRRLERVVDADVRAAHAKVLHLYARRAPLLLARDVAADNRVILQRRYQNGDVLVIEYLDGEVDLVNAELSLADVTAQLAQSWLELEAALGKTVGAN